MWIGPQSFLRLSCIFLQPFEYCVPRRILSIPPAPAVFDQGMVDVGPIEQAYIGKGASILVEAVRLERDLFSEDQL